MKCDIEKIENKIRKLWWEVCQNKNAITDLGCKNYALKKEIEEQKELKRETEKEYCIKLLLENYNDLIRADLDKFAKMVIVWNFMTYVPTPIVGAIYVEALYLKDIVKLWKTDLNYEGNPVTSFVYHNGVKKITYWDLSTKEFKKINEYGVLKSSWIVSAKKEKVPKDINITGVELLIENLKI